MTKEELITKIKKLGDMSGDDQISSYDVYRWLKDIRDNGITDDNESIELSQVRLGKYNGQPLYVTSLNNQWEYGKGTDIEIHCTLDEWRSGVSPKTAQGLVGCLSKAKLVKTDD